MSNHAEMRIPIQRPLRQRPPLEATREYVNDLDIQQWLTEGLELERQKLEAENIQLANG